VRPERWGIRASTPGSPLARGCSRGDHGFDVRLAASRTRPRLPTYEHVRDLWTLHGIQSTVTAAIWRNDFGLELRVDHGGELVESRLSDSEKSRCY